MGWRGWIGAAAVGIGLMLPAVASAQLRTCVQVEAPPAEVEALSRLIKTELDRHASHRAATEKDDCQAHLTVDVIDLGAAEGRWITARINTQVPARERIGPDGTVPAVERLLTVVLHNDPLVLRGPESNAWIKRQARALELRSVTHYGVELYELAAPLGSSFDTLPGLAISLRREVSALHIGVRLGGAFNPASSPQRLRLRTQVDAQLEAALYASPAAATSLFASAMLGLVYHRFEGPAVLDGPDARGTATSTGLSIALRGGLEMMRTSNVRLVTFLQLQAPAFASQDPDHGVIDAWVPSALLGAGCLF